MHRRLLSTLILLAAALIVALPVTAQDGGIDIVGGDEESLRAFLERFLMPIYAVNSGGQQGQIIIGALPDDLEFDLPLPEGAQVIGSLAPVGAPMVSVQIYFDAPQSAADVIAFYEEALPESGDWRSVTAYQPQGGFTTAAPMSGLPGRASTASTAA